ncbi:MAG: heparinase II/III-family protein, partial [Nannocystaceae bacterium]
SFARASQPRLAEALAPALSAMLAALPAFTHPDGDVALWGDSQRDAPVTPAGLMGRLGRPLPSGPADAAVSGFARRRWGPWTLLWNRGDVGLPHQVGHVHGDALAIELSLGATRIVVDAGVGTYAIGPERRYARSTAAHNTVTVGTGNDDQHELWASHRIGARGRVQTLALAEHRLAGRVQGHAAPTAHRRTIEHVDGRILITDVLEDPTVPGVARYFVPATFAPTVHDDAVRFQASGRQVQLRSPGGSWHLGPAPGWLGMARDAPRICLSLPLSRPGLRVELSVAPTSTR